MVWFGGVWRMEGVVLSDGDVKGWVGVMVMGYMMVYCDVWFCFVIWIIFCWIWLIGDGFFFVIVLGGV